MKKTFGIMSAVALLLLIWGGAAAQAKDIVLNTGFETGDTLWWQQYGSIQRGVELFDVDGDTINDMAYWQIPWNAGGGQYEDGGITQQIPLIAGVTYTVSMDICYHNC